MKSFSAVSIVLGVASSSFGNQNMFSFALDDMADGKNHRILTGAIPHPYPNNRTFVIDEGDDLDSYQCTHAILNIDLYIGDIDLSRVNTASLVMPAFDVDAPNEINHAYFNDVNYGELKGRDQAWHLNTFVLNKSDILVNSVNRIMVDIDIRNTGWCVSIDWVAVEFDYHNVFPNHSDRLVDDHSNTNGKSHLEVSLEFENPSDTSCNAQASLLDSNGQFIASITRVVGVTSSQGVSTIDLKYRAVDICHNNVNGPYTVSGVLVTCDNGVQYLKANAHTTAAYGLNQFEGCTNRPSPPPTITPSVQGDPHFKTWAGESYDFHGVCDLVLLRNNKFENGLGMDIHTRTSKMRSWSYVSVAAVRVGEDILEVMGGAKENNFWINGVLGEEMISNNNDENTLIATISGYPIYFHQVNNKQRTFVIDLGEEEKIVIGTWNSFVRIQFENAKSEHFKGSVGLMGSFSEGIRLARDNITVLEDFNVFGQEWQVLQSERKLFHTIEGPQHPTKCAIPSSSEMRRILGESQITLLDAKKACVDVNKDVADLCVFDVMATNDEMAVGAY